MPYIDKLLVVSAVTYACRFVRDPLQTRNQSPKHTTHRSAVKNWIAPVLGIFLASVGPKTSAQILDLAALDGTNGFTIVNTLQVTGDLGTSVST